MGPNCIPFWIILFSWITTGFLANMIVLERMYGGIKKGLSVYPSMMILTVLLTSLGGIVTLILAADPSITKVN